MNRFLNRIKNSVNSNQGLGFLSLGNIAANSISGLFWIILAAFVTTDIYGKSGYVTSIATVSSTIVLLGFPIFITTYLAKGLIAIRYEVSSLVLILSLPTAIIVFIIFHNLPLSLLVVGLSFFSISVQDMVGQGHYKEYAFTNIGQRAVNLGLSLMLYLTYGFDGLILGYSISYLIFSYRALLNLRHFRMSFSLIKERKNFLLHSWSLDISRMIVFSTDKLLIAPIFGFAVLGLYQLGIQFLMIGAMIPNILFAYLLREESRGTDRKNVKLLGLAISLGISAIVLILSPYAIPIVFPKFVAAIPLIQVAIWGTPLMAMSSILGTKWLATERTKPVFVSAIIFFAVTYSSMYYLGSLLGAIGLVYGLLLALGSEVAVMFFYTKQNFLPLNIRENVSREGN